MRLSLENYRQGRRASVFTPNYEKYQGTIWNKKSIFKGNTDGTIEAEMWIEKVQGYSF